MRFKCQERDYAWLEVHSTGEAAKDDFIVWDSTVLFQELELRQQRYCLGSLGDNMGEVERWSENQRFHTFSIRRALYDERLKRPVKKWEPGAELKKT